jgi:plastocyanin
MRTREHRWAMQCATLVAVASADASCLYPQVPAVYEGGLDDASAMTRESGEVIPEFNDCTVQRFVDRSAAGADRTVSFGGGSDPDNEFSYAPACLVVAAGQSVTFVGNFSIHPLRAGDGPDEPMAGTPGNPIPATTAGTSVTVPFPSAGTYPYYCNMHYASGMAGVVHVR